MSLHALGYCERLFYLEEVEEIRVADARVYAGRELHTALADDDPEGDWQRHELTSERLGLTGKVDCLRRRDGVYIPYEHKRGRAAKNEDGSYGAWLSDRLQIIAYAILLEETLEASIPEGRIRYHATNVTVRVPIDQAARKSLDGAIARARSLRQSVERPPITENERLCTHCSLAPVCLPEEVRHHEEPERRLNRLFPPDRDGATLHVLSSGTRVGRSSESLVVTPKEGPAKKYPVRGVESVMLHGMSQISTQAARLCADHQIGIHWLTAGGKHIASTVPTIGQVQRRIRQYRALSDEETCLRLAKSLTRAKIGGQLAYLLRTTRGQPDQRKSMTQSIAFLRESLASLNGATNRDALRGHEGAAAVRYFEGLRSLLGDQVPVEFRSARRSRRPPLDRLNALLSFGYGLLHTAVLQALLASGLEPALGFFHTPRSAAYPLVLDLMELFRVPLWDLVVVGSLNRGQWQVDDDFNVTPAKVWLSQGGRAKAIDLFEARLAACWKHPILGYSLSYARTIELEARLLEKEWTGEPGLFARSRLR
ncbi:CRISPR-associated protein Cas4/endonuclease Cas1 fusion [Planctomycetes bacterium Pan216]|uniref:CRISPR-associated endonuclease Cas1 n=2 Tax=Kolteria novifilia TaxID=2527975 RepID=A0A518B231_9BACT|nr:CRISPR-associated protein Cas4/endonuclease Cas1 fusion [Planctomycetes bacterium Pan216]